MSEQSERFERAADFFGSVVDQISDSQWDEPTPCDEWNVRGLLNHVVVEQLWAPLLLEGKTIADVGSTFDGDQLGSEPKEAWRESSLESRAWFGSPGAMERTVHLSYGDDSAVNYCDQMTVDALIHGWDLARAIDADETLPTDLVDWAYGALLPMQELLIASGVFGTPVEIPESADQQSKLLGLLGRQPARGN